MKILVLHPSDEAYGADKILLLTVSRLAARGAEVLVLLPEDRPVGSLTAKLSELDSVAVERPANLAVLRRAKLSGLNIVAYARDLLRARNELAATVRRFDPDVMYVNTLAPIVGMLPLRLQGTERVVHCHEIQLSLTGRALHTLAALTAGRIICVSDAVAEAFPSFASKKIVVVRNGIPAAAPQPEDRAGRSTAEPLRVVFVGRLSEWKGLDTVLHLAEQAEALGIVLTVVGSAVPDDDYGQRVEQRLQELDATEAVRFLGFSDRIGQIMQDSDVVLVPSVKPDPYPTVVLEALSVGTPVLTSQLGGASEAFIDGLEGWLVDTPTPAAFEKKISEIAAMTAESQVEMRTAASTRFEQSHRLESFYQRLEAALPSLDEKKAA